MSQEFSIHHRFEQIEQVISHEIDLLVIGGGITGAGIALDAQSRGIETVLIEMQDFAAGTSSRSTKLVHGGLRYLKQLEIGLVAEVGKERAIVYENGPHITKPEWMLLPIIKGGSYGMLASSIGIRVYDFLAGVKKSERRQMLNIEETLKKEPLLRKEGLMGAGYYVEYRTDDARLTIEVLKKAIEFGAKAFNYMKANDFIYKNGKLVGVRVIDLLNNRPIKIYAKKIVNATGPWVDSLREKDGSKKGKYLHWTKGVHIVIDETRFPLKQSVYFDTPDGRMIFAIPRDGKAYIGTTDTDFNESLEHPRMTKADRDYILRAVNYMFPPIQLKPEDVESSWAGVRPLIHEEGKAPSEISRKEEIFHSETGLITIAGGKLTGYRKMGEKVTDLVASELRKELGKKYKSCYTERIILSGGVVGGSISYLNFIDRKINEGISKRLTQEESSRLVHRYGANVDQVYDLIEQGKQEAAQFGLPLDLYGSLIYSLKYEMAATPADFFIRRTGSLFFNIELVKKWGSAVLKLMEKHLGWETEETAMRIHELEQEIINAIQAK